MLEKAMMWSKKTIEQFKKEMYALWVETQKSKALKKKIGNLIHDNPHYYLYLFLMMIGLLHLYICINITNGTALDEFLFYNPTEPFADMFMDYYNAFRNVYMDNPFTQIKAMYPPINYLLMALFCGFIPGKDIFLDFESFRNVDYALLLTMRNSRSAMYSYFCYSFIFILLFIVLVNRILRKHSVRMILFYDITLLFSWGFLYLFDRGNFLLPVIVFCMFYFLSEESESSIVQEIGLISLSIAICMKLYPVFFSIYLLTRKQYAKFIRLTIYSVVIFLFPFVFYGGWRSVLEIIKNIFLISDELSSMYYGSNISFSGMISVLKLLTGQHSGAITFLHKVGPHILLLSSLITSFFLKKRWKIALLLTCAFIMWPSCSMIYTLVYLLIPLTLFIVEKEKTMFDYVYTVFFVLCMSVIPYVAYDVRVNLQLYDGINITYGQIFAMIAMTAMMFFLLGEGIFRLLKQLTEGLFQTADNLFAIYREETASSPAIPLSVMECLISGIAAVLIAFALTIQQDSARYADFMISFWRYAAALLPSAFCLYMGMFMRRAKNISIFSIKDNAVGILLPPCLYALIVFVGSMIASLTQNGFLTVIGVLRYFLGVILSAILSYFFILGVRMYIKHFENFSIIFLMFFSPFAFLNLIAIVLPELHIQFLNPIYLPCGYLLSGLSASWEGFISFAYQFAYYLFFAAAGGWVVLKYYIRCYESLVKKPDYLSIRAFLLMVRYRDRGNL